MGLNGGTSELPMPVLQPADHQVAGHQNAEGRVGSSVDESGRFYKPLQDGERGNREVEFYEKLEMDEGVPSHIRSFFPKYFGTIFIEAPIGGKIRYGIMEDLTHGFHNPSIIDLKIGFRTWYPEASEHNMKKHKLKDSRTTSGALGFRVSGMQVYEASCGTTFKEDRDWARNLTVDDVTVALKRFSTQTNYHFAASSVLVIVDAGLVSSTTKENEKTCPSNASNSVAVKLVDFAHTYSGKSGLDENFLEGLKSLIHLLSSIVELHSS